MITLLEPGAIVGAYRVGAVVGRGGMGTVYEATQLSLQRTVALKLLSSEFGEDPEFRKRFRLEGLLQAGLDHPHIVPVYEAGDSDSGLFLAMRLVRGPNLKRLIASEELTPVRALDILDQVADALDTAHEAGLIHRDIKPQNILVARSDRAFLADFGLTKSPDAHGLTRSGTFLGSLNYIAPEQIRDQVSSARSDVYSLGAVLFEALTGAVPYPRSGEAALMYAHLEEPAPRVTEHRQDVPAALDRVVGRALSKDPEQRQPSAGALLVDARRALSGGASSETLAARRPRPLDRQPTARRSRTRLAVLLVGLALAALLALLVARSGEDRDAPGRSLRSSAVELRVRADWRPHRARGEIPGLRLSRPIAASLADGGGGELVAGVAATGDPTMLPEPLLERLTRPLPAPRRIQLGTLQAYRYADVRVEGISDRLDLFVSPTTGGIATVACVGGRGTAASGFRRACDEAAASLRLRSAIGFHLPPRRAYVTGLDAIFDAFIAKRDVLRDRLRYAASQELQINAAADLSGLYKTATRNLARIGLSPQETDLHDTLLAAMRQARDGYREMTETAIRADRVAFRLAGRDARIGEAEVNRALAELDRLGFREPI